MAEGARDDSWMPDGWDEWSPKRRTLWRREKQADRMERLAVEPEKAAERDRWVEHLRQEADDLRRQVAQEEGGDADA